MAASLSKNNACTSIRRWEQGHKDSDRNACILAADHLVLIVLLGEHAEIGLEILGVGTSAAATEAEHQVKRGLLLDVVVGQCVAIFQLFPCEDETLLVRRDTYD
jgi:hypothetical protein